MLHRLICNFVGCRNHYSNIVVADQQLSWCYVQHKVLRSLLDLSLDNYCSSQALWLRSPRNTGLHGQNGVLNRSTRTGT